MSKISLSNPSVQRHGQKAFRDALRIIGGHIASTEIDGAILDLATDSLYDVTVPLSRWFTGGSQQFLVTAKERAALPILLYTGVCLSGGAINDRFIAATALLHSLVSLNAMPYREACLPRLVDNEDAPARLVRIATLNALDLSCDDSSSVLRRLKEATKILSSGHVQSADVFSCLFSLQECCARKTEWPAKNIRAAQELVETSHDSGISGQAWRLCVYQCAVIMARNA